MEADIANDFNNTPGLPAFVANDMDMFKSPPAPGNAWAFIGSGPLAGINGANATVNQVGVLYSNGVNRIALGRSNLLDLGTPRVLSWTGLVSTDWSDQANWNPSQVPSAFNQRVTIPNTLNKPIYSGSLPLSIRTLNIGLGATLSYGGDISLDSSFTNSGALTCSGLLTFSGANVAFVAAVPLISGAILASTVFNYGGSGGVSNLQGLMINNTSTSGVVIPGNTQTIHLSDSLKLNINTRFNLGGSSLTLKASPTRTAKIGTIPATATLSGATNVTSVRYTMANTTGWHFLGSPILGQTLSDFGDDFDIFLPLSLPNVYTIGAQQSNLFLFDGAAVPIDGAETNETGGWRIPTSGTIDFGKGFRVFLKNIQFKNQQRTFQNTGTVIQGDAPLIVSGSTPFNASGYSGGGWNFLCNPYPAPINWDATTWTKTSVNAAIYIWNGLNNNYMTYVAGSGGIGLNGGSNIIPSHQGFMVKVTASTAVLTARETVKSAASGTFARTATANEKLILKLISPTGKFDENVIRINEESTFGFDGQFDAYKLPGAEVNLSMQTEDGNLVVQTIPGLENSTIIPLTVQSASNGNHTFEFENLNTFLPSGQQAYLKDLYLNSLEPIHEGDVVSFNISSDPSSQGPNRFEILFSTEDVTIVRPSGIKTAIRLFPNPALSGEFQIETPQDMDGSVVRIFNVTGQVVYTATLSGNQNVWKLKTELSSGIYQVELRNSKEVFNTKLKIQN